jgi:hypothetical protein
MSIRNRYAHRSRGLPCFYDDDSDEIVRGLYPIEYADDFLGCKLEKSIAGENTTAPWAVLETSTTVALRANEPNGVAEVAISNTDRAELAVLHWGDQLPLMPARGLVVQFVARMPVLPTLGTEAAEFALGVASAHAAALNDVATNAWFYLNTTGLGAVYWESDDTATDNDDQATGVTITAADGWHVFEIDFTSLSAVKFRIDGALVGTASMAAATSAVVQPYIRAGKGKSSANTSKGTWYVDAFRAWQSRA